ncbi:MAG: heme o synthase [Bacteroidota bacterium]
MNPDWNETAALTLERSRVADFLALTKPGLSLFSVATAVGGAYLAADGMLHLVPLLTTLFGTLFAAAGAVALNQYRERGPDSLMQRTANRPMAEGRIRPMAGLSFGLVLALSGVAILSLAGNILAGSIALGTLIVYLLLYTPLKRTTPYATIVGAIAGALPPMIGWAVVREDLAPQAWTLFAILFVWQMPHFYSLALMYRDDYARGGYQILTVLDPTGRRTVRHILSYCTVLLPVSLLPSVIGFMGHVYAVGILILSLVFLLVGMRLYQKRSLRNARALFLASLAYLPVVSLLITADRLLTPLP